MDPKLFKAIPNVKDNVIEVRDNSLDAILRLRCEVDEVESIANQMLSAAGTLRMINSSPLMNMPLINEAVEKAKSIPRGTDAHPAHVMLDYYQSSLRLFSDIARSAKDGSTALKTCLEIVDVMLQKHKHHIIPESGPARHP